MSKELTIDLDDELYTGLMKSVGEQNVSRFIESVVRSYFKTDSSEIYDVELPVAAKIHSPRLADRSLADQFQMEMSEETQDGKL